VQLGHTYNVDSVAFSANGKLMVSAGGRAVLWETQTGRELRHFEPPHAKHNGNTTNSAALSPDGRRLITNSLQDRTARLWDAATGQQLRQLDGHFGPIATVCFSSRGDEVLTAGGRTTVLWNADSGTEIRRFETVPGKVVAAGISPDGRAVLTAGGRNVTLWNTATGLPVWRIQSTLEAYTSAVFSSDGREILIGGEVDGQDGADKGLVLLVDAKSGKRLRSFEGHKNSVIGIALSPDGKRALTSSYDGTTREWDASTGKEIFRFKERQTTRAVAYSPNGRHLLLANRRRSTLFSETTKSAELQFEGHAALDGELFEEQATFSQDGRYLLIGNDLSLGNTPKSLQLWDISQGGVVERFLGDFSRQAFDAQLAAGGHYQLIKPDDGSVLPMSYDHNNVAVQSKPDGVDAPAYSPNNEPAEEDVGGTSDGENPNIYDPDLDAERQKHPPEEAISYIRVSAPCGDKGDAIEQHVGYLVEFARNCQIAVASGQNGTTQLLNVDTGKLMASLASFDDGTWAVFDPEGRFDTNQLDGGAQMQWVMADDPMRALPLEIFMRDYYTPGLLTRVMKGEKLPDVRSIAEIKNRVQPVVKVVSVMPSQKKTGRVDVVVHAASARSAKGVKGGLQDLRLFRDGQMVADGYREGALKPGDFIFRNVMLKSDVKKVTFTAYAFNSERIKSTTASLDYEVKTPATAVAKRKAFLFQVGVNHTAAKGCELKYSVNDAETMSAALSEKLRAQGFELVPVKLESAAASDASGAAKELIHEQLKMIAAKATPDDVFFMSFSGHGFSAAGGAFYVLPSSLQGDCAHVDDAMLKTAISADELADWLRPIDAGETTLILDACYSAESVQAGDFKPGPMGSRGLGQVAYDKRMRVLAASQSDAVAHEYDYLHEGLLSYVLVKDGLEKDKADWKPKDGKITVGEWLSYAAAAVPEFKPSVPTGENKGTTVAKTVAGAKAAGQVPVLFDFSHGDTLVLAK